MRDKSSNDLTSAMRALANLSVTCQLCSGRGVDERENVEPWNDERPPYDVKEKTLEEISTLDQKPIIGELVRNNSTDRHS